MPMNGGGAYGMLDTETIAQARDGVRNDWMKDGDRASAKKKAVLWQRVAFDEDAQGAGTRGLG